MSDRYIRRIAEKAIQDAPSHEAIVAKYRKLSDENALPYAGAIYPSSYGVLSVHYDELLAALACVIRELDRNAIDAEEANSDGANYAEESTHQYV